MLFRAIRGFVYKSYSDIFFDLFSEKGRGKLYDKSAVLHVRWCEFVHQVLASQDESEIAKESSSRFMVLELSKAVLIPDGVLTTNA